LKNIGIKAIIREKYWKFLNNAKTFLSLGAGCFWIRKCQIRAERHFFVEGSGTWEGWGLWECRKVAFLVPLESWISKTLVRFQFLSISSSFEYLT
jgi:hypothetical protein